MPDSIKKKVEALGKRGVRAIERGNITFRNRNGEKFSWENDAFEDLVVEKEEKRFTPIFLRKYRQFPWWKVLIPAHSRLISRTKRRL